MPRAAHLDVALTRLAGRKSLWWNGESGLPYSFYDGVSSFTDAAGPAFGTWTSDAIMGNCVQFNGSDSAQFPGTVRAVDLNIDGAKARTMFAEYRIPFVNATVWFMGMAQEANGNGANFHLGKEQEVRYYVNSNAVLDATGDTHVLNEDVVVRAVLTYDGSNIRLYQTYRGISQPAFSSPTNILLGTGKTLTTPNNNNGWMCVGRKPNATPSGDGGGSKAKIAYAAFIEGAWSDAQALAHLADPASSWGMGAPPPILNKTRRTKRASTGALIVVPRIVWATQPTGGPEGATRSMSVTATGGVATVTFQIKTSGGADIGSPIGPVAVSGGAATTNYFLPAEGSGYKVVATPDTGTAKTSSTFNTVSADGSGLEVEAIQFANYGATSLGSGYANFGLTFNQGEVAEGTGLTADIGGTDYDVQLDVRRRYPDFSAMHVSATLPRPASIAAGATVNVSLINGPGLTGSAVSLTTALGARSASLTIQFVTGSPAGMISRGLLTYNLKQLLLDAITGSSIAYWQQGPLCTEGRIYFRLANSSVRFVVDFTAWENGDFAWHVEWHNDISSEVAVDHGNVTYDTTLVLDGVTVVNRSAFVHPLYQNWMYESASGNSGWHGLQEKLNVIRTPERYFDTKVSQWLDKTLPLTSTLSSYQTDPTFGFTGTLNGKAWGEPFSSNGIVQNDGATGHRRDIGFSSGPANAYYMTGDWRALKTVLGWAQTGLHYHCHHWWAAENIWMNSDHRPAMWLSPTAQCDNTNFGVGNPADPADGKLTYFWKGLGEIGDYGFEIATNHMPDLGCAGYLITGRRWMLDVTQSKASWAAQYWPASIQDSGSVRLFMSSSGGGTPQMRGLAWALRDVVNAAWVSPDGSPEKSYFDRLLDGNLQYMLDVRTRLDGWYGEAAGQYDTNTRVIETWQGGWHKVAIWQMQYLLKPIIMAERRGYAKAATWRASAENFFLGGHEQGATFHYRNMLHEGWNRYPYIAGSGLSPSDANPTRLTTWAARASRMAAEGQDFAAVFPAWNANDGYDRTRIRLICDNMAQLYKMFGSTRALAIYNLWMDDPGIDINSGHWATTPEIGGALPHNYGV